MKKTILGLNLGVTVAQELSFAVRVRTAYVKYVVIICEESVL